MKPLFPHHPDPPRETEPACSGRRRRLERRVVHVASAFSLIEVTLAIGIIAFAVLPLVGLIPVGLNVLKAARDEAAAASSLETISTAIRKASVDETTGVYTALGAFSDLSWSIEVSPELEKFPPLELSMGGMPVGTGLDKRLVAQVEILPPSTAAAPGEALITIAWPSQAVWDSNTKTWSNAQGSVSTWLKFVPSP